MKMKVRSAVVTMLLVGLSSVSFATTPIPKPTPHVPNDILFDKKKIKLGSKTIEVEVADTDPKRERGLMFREELPEDKGMLFIFDQERILSFWMKNTLIPLSIGYFDKNKKLLEIHEMTPAVLGEREIKTYPSRLPAMYALEMPKAWFARNQIKPGFTFTFVRKP